MHLVLGAGFVHQPGGLSKLNLFYRITRLVLYGSELRETRNSQTGPAFAQSSFSLRTIRERLSKVEV